MKDSYFGSHKGNVKTLIGNSNNSSSHGERAKAARFYFASGQVGPKQLVMLSGGDRFDSVMIKSNCGSKLNFLKRCEAA